MQEVGQVTVPGDFAETYNDPDTSEGGDFCGEVFGAVANLLGGGFIAGWGATHNGGDPGVAEFETVVAGDGFGAVGEAQIVEDGVHEVSGTVAGEGPAGAIGTMSARGESKNKHPGTRI